MVDTIMPPDSFLGNETSDILFRNITSGDAWFEAISNGAFAGWTQIGGSDTTYAVVGVGDYFGNNTSDILFRNSAGNTWVEQITIARSRCDSQQSGLSVSWSISCCLLVLQTLSTADDDPFTEGTG